MNLSSQSFYDQRVPDVQLRPAGSYWLSESQPLPAQETRLFRDIYFHLTSVDQCSSVDRTNLLNAIASNYVVESPEAMELLKARPAVITLLLEASNHLDAAFGLGKLKLLRLIHDDVSGMSIFGIVAWRESIESGREALSKFDEDWWLENCSRAGGTVNFNIELI